MFSKKFVVIEKYSYTHAVTYSLYSKIFCIIEEYQNQHKRKKLKKGKWLTFLILLSKYAIAR